MISLPLVIMAGGKSSRMGNDKALLPFGEFPTLTQYQISRFQTHFTSLHVSCKTKDKFDFEASFIEDNPLYRDSSPLVALATILEHFKTPVCVLSVDTPFVTADIFETLYTKMNDTTEAIIARSPFGSHQLCAIYAPPLLSKIKTMLSQNEHKIGLLLQNSHTVFVDFKSDEPFLNLNHPSDYEHAKGLL